MGVDYYTCQFCEECFTTSGDFGQCYGCSTMWCCSCDADTPTWKYGGEHYCALCFSTSTRDIKGRDMRDYLLTKYGLEFSQVYEEMRALPKFSTPLNTYVCKYNKEDHTCSSKECLVLGDDWDGERGLCCLARYKEDKDAYCTECAKEKKIKQSL